MIVTGSRNTQFYDDGDKIVFNVYHFMLWPKQSAFGIHIYLPYQIGANTYNGQKYEIQKRKILEFVFYV